MTRNGKNKKNKFSTWDKFTGGEDLESLYNQWKMNRNGKIKGREFPTWNQITGGRVPGKLMKPMENDQESEKQGKQNSLPGTDLQGGSTWKAYKTNGESKISITAPTPNHWVFIKHYRNRLKWKAGEAWRAQGARKLVRPMENQWFPHTRQSRIAGFS